MITMLKKLVNKVKTDGLDGIWFRILRLFNKDIFYNNLFEKKKYELSLNLYKKHNNSVIYGPYKGMFFSENNHWGIGDLGPKIIGLYEFEVQNKLIDLVSNFKIENFVNIGAAEGYHAIGIAKKTRIQNFVLYEIDKKGQEILKENILKNELKKNIKIENEANLNSIYELNKKLDFSKTLFLIDIEGFELELFNDEILGLLKNSFLIIENHRFLLSKTKQIKYQELVNKFDDSFNVELVSNTGRNISQINEISNLSENELMMISSESRPKMMEWFVLTPKTII